MYKVVTTWTVHCIDLVHQTLAGILNLAGPPLLGLLASCVDTTMVMVVLGASLVIGAIPLFLASIVSCWRRRDVILV